MLELIRRSPVVYTLILINISCFALFELSSLSFEETLALYFPQNVHYREWQFISSLFMHGGLMHLLLNMFALLMFGMVIERYIGSLRFFILYFLAGLGAGIIYTAVNNYQFDQWFQHFISLGLTPEQIKIMLDNATYRADIPNLTMEDVIEFYRLYHIPMVGASGAIYGVLVAFAMSFPNYRLFFLFVPYPVAAKYFVPIVLLFDLFSGMTGFSIFGGGIAHFAHIGGAIIGSLVMLYFFTFHAKAKP